MAIKNLVPQLAERGKIKIGEKGEMKPSSARGTEAGQSGKKFDPPKKLDHFVITTMQRDTAGRLMPDTALMERLKQEQKVQKLTEIPIRLLYDDNELNFQTRLACYKKVMVNGKERLGCWCSGDNEKAMRMNDKGKFEEITCPCERQNPLYQGDDKCRSLGTLQCLIDGTSRVGGVWRFRTTGWNSIKSIIGSMDMIKTLTGGGQVDADDRPVGPLAGIPLRMMVSPKSTIIPTTGQSVTVWVVHLEFDGLDDRLRELGLDIMRKRIDHRMKMFDLQTKANRLLIAPYEEPMEEQLATAEEFFPSAVSALPPEGKEKGQEAGTEHTDQNGEGPETDPLNLDRSTAPEQVFTIPSETKRPEETVPPGYDGLTSTHPQTNGSKNGGRKSLGERLF